MIETQTQLTLKTVHKAVRLLRVLWRPQKVIHMGLRIRLSVVRRISSANDFAQNDSDRHQALLRCAVDGSTWPQSSGFALKPFRFSAAIITRK